MPDGKDMDHTPGQCLRSLNFWLLLVSNGIASGAGLTLLNNLGQQVTPASLAWRRICRRALDSAALDGFEIIDELGGIPPPCNETHMGILKC